MQTMLTFERRLGPNDYIVVKTDHNDPPGRVMIGNASGAQNAFKIGSAVQIGYGVSADAFADAIVTALTGTVTVTKNSTAVVGIGTLFTTELVVGDTVQTDGKVIGRVASIADNTHLTLAVGWAGVTTAGATLNKSTPTIRALAPLETVAFDLPFSGVLTRDILCVYSVTGPIDVRIESASQFTMLQDGRLMAPPL